MAEQVTKWAAKTGKYHSYYDTQEEAEKAELRHNFIDGFIALEKANGNRGIGSPDRVSLIANYIWLNKDVIQRLLNGEKLELEVKEEEK